MSKVKIAPSILSADFSQLGRAVTRLAEAGADMIHIDVMDGHFVPNITMGPSIIKSIRKFTNLPFDVHLMVEEPENMVSQFIKSGADIVTFHLEATNKPNEIIDMVRSYGKKVGISIKPKTGIEEVSNFLEIIDQLLIMTVEPGFGGQLFLNDQLEKIAKAKKYIKEKKLQTLIEVDGGINQHTAKLAISNGADILVAGSYIFGNNQEEADFKEKISSLKC
jgi:ribulose-phosphate 3-epimerase